MRSHLEADREALESTEETVIPDPEKIPRAVVFGNLYETAVDIAAWLC
jgi:hypothetical protein